jgi:protoheme IX farnesyltransferase
MGGPTMTASIPPTTAAIALPADWRDLFALTKPRVMSLVIFTGLCGLIAAPERIHPVLAFTAILCIAMGAGGAAALNQWWEADLDAGMKRTAKRPLPQGRLDRTTARDFAGILCAASVFLMGFAVSWLAAGILAVSIVYYAVVYTIWLKPRTPQNIVIGGGAGAFPPLIGWVAATGHVTLMPVVLFAIIFFWTPPHFWALSLLMKDEYAKVGVPMMPVVRGERETRRQILLYTGLLYAVTQLPFCAGGFGTIYVVASLLVGGAFIGGAVLLQRRADRRTALKLYLFSLLYLALLFCAMVVDAKVM